MAALRCAMRAACSPSLLAPSSRLVAAAANSCLRHLRHGQVIRTAAASRGSATATAIAASGSAGRRTRKLDTPKCVQYTAASREELAARYLGNYPVLVAKADQRKGKLTPRAARKLLKEPHILEPMGITSAEQFKFYDIDHIIPLSCGGQDHPANYAVMPRSANRHFRASVNTEKVAYVGLDAAVAAAMHHCTVHSLSHQGVFTQLLAVATGASSECMLHPSGLTVTK